MWVRLTQIDGKLPNLALMKMSAWFKEQGYNVFFSRSAYRGLFEPNYKYVFGSSIFSFSKKKLKNLKNSFLLRLLVEPEKELHLLWKKLESQRITQNLIMKYTQNLKTPLDLRKEGVG